jgi:predicted nucleotidyltransferase
MYGTNRMNTFGCFSSHVAGITTFIYDELHEEYMLNPEFRMLEAFLKDSGKELYARQIERMTGTNHERAGVYLAELVKQNVLLREKKGKQVFYRLNKNSELALKALAFAEMEIKRKFIKTNKDRFVVYDLISQINRELRPDLYFVLLFGSVAREHQRKESDIDLLFVLSGNKKTKARLEEMIKKQEMLTGKKISFHPVTIKELGKLWKREPVYKNIWDERIVFFGEENFWSYVFKEGNPYE